MCADLLRERDAVRALQRALHECAAAIPPRVRPAGLIEGAPVSEHDPWCARIGVSVRDARVIHASAQAALIGQCRPQTVATRNTLWRMAVG